MHAPGPSSGSAELVSERFVDRHIGPRQEDITAMLDVVGVPSLDALIAETIPREIRQDEPLSFGPAVSEPELLERMREVASRNSVFISLIGQGYYQSHLPSIIQ